MKDEFLNPSGLSRVWDNITTWITEQDYAKKSDIPDVPVTGVTVNGESVVENGTAAIPEIPTVPENVSAFNNDAGYLTNVTVRNYKTFPENWARYGAMRDLIDDINNDSTAEPGMSYMDTVGYNDLPGGMIQAEMMVDIMSQLDDLGKVIRFTLTSTDRYPYHWEYTSAYGSSGTWRGYLPDTGYIYLKDPTGGKWKLGVNTSGELVVTQA